MCPTRFAEDVDPELVERYHEIEERYRKSAPLRFSRRWKCDRRDCDGQPHEGWDHKHARGSQVIPEGWDVFYLVGGRGSGKTWAGAHNFAQLVLQTEPDDGDDHTEWAVVAPTYRDARDVAIEGPSGLIRALGGYAKQGGLVDRWDRSYGHLRLVTGQLIYVDSADDGAVRVQGKNLYGAWATEIGLWKSWKRAWHESLVMAVRKGPARIFCDGTPKRSSLAVELINDPTVGQRRLRTLDNLANLAEKAVARLLNRYQGTRLGQQELEGILIDEIEGALWKRSGIDADRVDEHLDIETANVYWTRDDGTLLRPPPFWQTVVVGVDPADGLEEGDEQGWSVIAQSPDDHELYLLESGGERLAPWDFLNLVVDTALKYQPAPVHLVLEKNHGGRYLTSLLAQVMKAKGQSVPVKVVDATPQTGGKYTRAEEVVGLYERHKVHHLGTHAELEDQMVTWTGLPDPDTGKLMPSPDRMDSLVWALWDFRGYRLAMPEPNEGSGVYAFPGPDPDPTPIPGLHKPYRDPNEAQEIPSVRW